jgi:PKD repeat protein
MVEVGTATWCPSCPSSNTAWHSYYNSGNYDFEYCEMIDDMNSVAAARLDSFNLHWFPTSYFDGGYRAEPGSGNLLTGLNDAGNYGVYDVDVEITKCNWVDTAEIDIEVEITNNEATSYGGTIRVYIVEETSTLWTDYNGNPYYHAFLDFALVESCSIGSGSTYTTSTLWDGSSSYPGLDVDNCQVICAVFNDDVNTGYSDPYDQDNPPDGDYNPFTAYFSDDATAAHPVENNKPIAAFTTSPIYPEEDELITFTDESIDQDGIIISWAWDFGDGNSSTDENPTHSYSNPGYYTVSLTIEDDDSVFDTIIKTLIVTEQGTTVDEAQIEMERGVPIRIAADGTWGLAQDFKPEVNTLTHVGLLLQKYGNPGYDLVVELRETDPDGTLLDSINISPGDVSDSGYEWLTIDFVDTAVTPGNTYCVVLVPPSVTGDYFGYTWAFTEGDPYPDGNIWYTRTGGAVWYKIPYIYEFTFVTFGYDVIVT